MVIVCFSLQLAYVTHQKSTNLQKILLEFTRMIMIMVLILKDHYTIIKLGI